MFGYIKISKPEMRIKEYEMYKAVYCSLCKFLGKKYGFIARMMLNYDFTFLALLIMATNDGFGGTCRKRCVCNPFKKCTYCKSCNREMELPAAALIILARCKNLDNIADEKGVKKLAALMLKPFLSKPYKKAKKLYPELDKIANEYIASQSELEKINEQSLDKAAVPTALFLAKLFEMALPNDKKAAFVLGEALGKWIYITDALCDYKEDKQKSRYNPLLCGDTHKERARANLLFHANTARSAFELIEIKKFKDILANILYVGLDDVMEKELSK